MPGAAPSSTLIDDARRALDLASADPAGAYSLAHSTSEAARAGRFWVAASVADHAAGVAAMQLDDLELSGATLRSAIAEARRAGRPDLVAQARSAFAGTLFLQGRPKPAMREIGRALQDLSGVEAAKVLAKQAALLLVLGRHDEALENLRIALPALRRAGEFDHATRALVNRSLLHIAKRSFGQAESDLRIARQLAREHGLSTWSPYIEQNLGWLAANRGEIIAALEHYQAAQEQYEAIGSHSGTLHEARARLLLSLRLTDEARSAVDTAIALHQRQGRGTELVEANLLLSTVALVQGEPDTAQRAADTALAGYRRLRRADGIALARYARQQAALSRAPDAVTAAQARRCADDLARTGWLIPALDARIQAATLALSGDHIELAHRDLETAARARRTGSAEVRTRAWLAEALLRQLDGRTTAAKRAVGAGLRILEDYQATVGATDLRAHVTVHRSGLAGLGLEIALSQRRARQVLSFAERARATALPPRPPRPLDDPVLAHLLTDLRTTVSEIEDRRSSGMSTGELTRRQIQLEQTIAELYRRTPAVGAIAHRPRRLAELIEALGEIALVEYVEQHGDLYAVSAVDGAVHLHDLGPLGDLADMVAHLRFAIRRLARPAAPARSQEAAGQAARHGRTVLDERLFGPVRRRIGDRNLVVVPSRTVQDLPWGALPTCAGRAVTITPSARLWLAATERGTRQQGHNVAVAGPGLPNATGEAQEVARIHPRCTALTGPAAGTAAVLKELDGAIVAHVAAHCRLRPDNPLFSALVVADGPLTVHELERLRTAPEHVVLAACGAATPKVVADNEVLGLAAALLGRGTGSVVAPVVPVFDHPTKNLMVSYHKRLAGGCAPAVALADAQVAAASDGPHGWAMAAGFVCIGAGHRQFGRPAVRG